MSLFTCAPERFDLMDMTKAASPDTIGQAMLVPLWYTYLLLGKVDAIRDPGANTWT